MTEEEMKCARAEGESVFFSPASTSGTLEYLIEVIDSNSFEISNVNGEERGSVTFNPNGKLFFESKTNLENDRFIIDCKIVPNEEITALLFIKVGGVFPAPHTAFVEKQDGVYSYLTPFAEFGDSTQIEVQAVHPVSRDPFEEGFTMISCRFTRVRSKLKPKC